jgi:uncharacterized peroxidase-related enzyme
MAWIRTIDEAEATGELTALYAEIQKKRGKLSNILRVHSLNPKALQAHLDLYLSILFDASGLTRAEREAIAVVVSSVSGCTYCIRHHGGALSQYWKDRSKVDRLASDFRTVELSDRERAMLAYAEKLTQAPASMEEDDVVALRAVGFSDADILSINLIASYFNFVNRIALGLGVTFTAEEMAGYHY